MRDRFLVRGLAALLAFVVPLQSVESQIVRKPRAGAATATEPAAAAPLPRTDEFLPEAARLITLPRMTEPQIREFITDLALELELTAQYRRTGKDFNLPLPELSERISPVAVVTRSANNRTDLIRFGYVMHMRRLPQLWVYGISLTPGGLQVNADVAADKLDPVLGAMLSEREKTLSRLRLADLDSKIMTLSYVDADGALFALRAMGFSAVTDDDALPQDTSYRGNDIPLLTARGDAPQDRPPEIQSDQPAATPAVVSLVPNPAPGSDPSQSGLVPRFPTIRNLPTSISVDRLPLIVKMPSPDPRSLGLVGAPLGTAAEAAAARGEGSLGLTVVPSAATPLAPTVSAGTSQLLILYHPSQPDQLLKVQKVLDDVIDKPARQVFVEGLVLEISREGLEELGVQWTRRTGNEAFTLGTITPLQGGTGATGALSFERNSQVFFDPRQILDRINALVERNKAEILSRPSVLTLDNRQATIRVGTDIPIATSKDAGTGAAGGRVAFSFQYLPTGILLNVRPRITDDLKEISMLIDATVSATVPNADLTVRDPGTGQVLASAPTISTRRVQTYARIVNNQPLIIGGLVSRDQTRSEDRVPGLGDIPILGYLFGYTNNRDARREVIIVLTPSIVTEEFRATKWQLPRDDDRFDNFGTTLFREQYRIRAVDLIDSQHIRTNRRLIMYRNIVNRLIDRFPELSERQPFARFRANRVPGEFIFVSGMMSRMLHRLKLHDPVNLDKLVFFEGVKGPEFRTESVGGVLKRFGDGRTHESFFAKNPGKALALSFRFRRGSIAPEDMNTEPLAEVRLLDCPDRETWKKLLWELNHSTEAGVTRYTMLIQDPSDLERVKLAIALKNTILANGNEPAIIFDNFLPGKMLAMQEIAPDWERTLEGTVARYFFWGEFFYPAFTEELDVAIREMDATLRQPQMAQYLEAEGIRLP